MDNQVEAIARSRPIGVFDSGVGGLTVYKALRAILPHENFIYLGDTARLPYGTKSPETVAQYALQATTLLAEADIKLLVVACNTASACALPSLQKHLPRLPCLGVIEPSAQAAATASRNQHIAVLATDGTVRSGAYAAAIKRYNKNAVVTSTACSLLVTLAEEGWSEGAEAEAVIGRYLREMDTSFDTLVLGCTHFPLLIPTIRKLVKPSVTIIDSASVTAQFVRDYLQTHHLANTGETGDTHFWTTDSPERFARIARLFLGTDHVRQPKLVHIAPLPPVNEPDMCLAAR